MFKDEDLISKIIALVFCIKEQHTNSNLQHVFAYTDTYIQIYIQITMHTCVYTKSHTYTPSSYSLCFTHYVGLFSFGCK